MRYRFVGDPVEKELDLPPSRNGVELFGLSFRLGQAVDVSALQPDQQRVLARNSHFEAVVEAPAEETPAPAPRGKRAAPADE